MISIHEDLDTSITAWISPKDVGDSTSNRFAHVNSGYILPANLNEFYELDDILCEINAKITKFMSEQLKKVKRLQENEL